ncbi:Developmentally-regulated GTP-binding protein 1 [Nymphon striatum]|nr:Developmentally-regulated GTP-binding protein 1 [Nymphon striatum]
MKHMADESAQTTLDTLKEILSDQNDVCSAENNKAPGQKILCNIASTMSDRAATEVKFNSLLETYREEFLPLYREGYNDLSGEQQAVLSKLHSFFCGLHLLVGMADTVAAALKKHEDLHLPTNADLESDDELYDSEKSKGETGVMRLMARTQKNKATAGHLGLLKARMAKLRRELITPKGGSGGGTGEGFDVAKTGDARIGFVGFPSVGKSTLLTNLAGVYSEVAAYEFTTLTTVPGVIRYKGAKIQLLDLPGIIEGAKDGKGRGRQTHAVLFIIIKATWYLFVSVARTCSLIFIVLDVLKPLLHKQLLERELEGFGIRLNKFPPNIVFRRKDKGGINLQTMCAQSELDLDTVRTILSEYRIHNADITLRYDATSDDFIDVVEGNRVYVPCIYILNKIDQISIEHDVLAFVTFAIHASVMAAWYDELDIIYKVPHCVPISAHHKWNFDDLLERLWDYLKLIRIYTKPKGQLPDYESPVVLQRDHCTIEDFCNKIHRTIIKEFRYALVWGTSVKYNPQSVGKEHILHDEDVVQIVKK